MPSRLFLVLTLLSTAVDAQQFALRQIAGGLSMPVAITHASDSRIFVTLQGGQIVIYVAGMQRLWLFSEYSDLDPDAWPADLMEQIAEALGEKCVKEVDI